MEVNQFGQKDCFIKLFCEQKRSGFVRLMEAIDSLGLQVVNANVTTFNGTVQNILQVEVRFKDYVWSSYRNLNQFFTLLS